MAERTSTECLSVRRSEQRYRNLVELSADVIYVSDKLGNLTFLNDAGYKIHECAPEEILGRPWLEWVHPEDRERTQKLFMRMLEEGIDVFGFENRFVSKTGKTRDMLHNVTVLRDEKGEIVGTQGIATDITERKRAEEELQFKSMLLDNARDSIFVLDGEGRVIYVNEAAYKDRGFTREELIGKPIDQVDAPQYKERVRQRMAQLLRENSIRVETAHLTKDGAWMDVEVNARVVEFRGRKVIVGVLRDITEKKRMEEAIRESEERYRTLVENVDLGITLIDPTYRIVMANAGGEKLHKKDASEFAGRECFREFEKREEVCSHCPGTRAMLTGRPATAQTHGTRDDGSHYPVEIHAFPILKGDGTFRGFIEVVADITDRKRAEEAIRRYTAELEDSNRMKDLFTDIMHHDILNPLSVATGFAELLEQEETNPDRVAWLERIRKNLGNATELIFTATEFSRLKNLETIGSEDLNLSAVIAEVIEDLLPLAGRAGVAIENGIKESMPVRGNRIIGDVFANLISNAIKYAGFGRRIVVDGKGQGDSWRVRVIDFGEGIPDAEKPQVFTRFERKEKRGVKGSGLGLAIAKRIMELHGGRIRVEDNPEGGAIFVVEIAKNLNGRVESENRRRT